MKLEFHELANLFPMMTEEVVNDLVDDMLEHGQRHPIWRFEGMILDGRNRYNACLLKGIEPHFEEFRGADALAFVMSLNLHRRHLDESQRAMVAKKIATLLDGQRQVGKFADVPTQAEAAALVNVSERLVRSAGFVIDNGVPDLLEAVNLGNVSVSAAAEFAKQPKEDQAKQIAEAPTPADAVKASKLAAMKAAADRAGQAAIRRQKIDEPDEPEYEDTPAGRRRKARDAKERKKSADDFFESLAATGKLSDDEIADYRESGIMPEYVVTTACGSPQYAYKPDQAEVEKARADRAAAKAKLGADAVAPSDDQRKAALRLAIVNDNVVTFVPKDDGLPITEYEQLAADEVANNLLDITDHSVGAHAIQGSLSVIDLAQTTPEAFWAIFGTPGCKPDALKWLDTAIKKLAEIKAAQPQATKAAS
jgi:hypothetical protein